MNESTTPAKKGDDKFSCEVFNLNKANYKAYLTEKDLNSIFDLIETVKFLIVNPEKAVLASGAIDKYLTKLSGWLMFIGKLSAEASSDRMCKFADLFKEYKHKQFDARVKNPEYKKMTDGTATQYVNADIKAEIRNEEVFNNMYESLRELVQSLRAIVRAREISRGEKLL